MKDKSKTHYSDGILIKVPNSNRTYSLLQITACGHMYDAGISSRIWDEVTCKHCLKKMGSHERVL